MQKSIMQHTGSMGGQRKVSMKGKIGLLILMLALFASNVIAGEPEFDGAYIKTKDGKYIDLKESKCYVTQIIKNGMNLMDAMSAPQVYYVMDSSGLPMSADNFVGLLIKGQYKFENFSFHPLVENRLGNQDRFMENHGPATNNKPFYSPGQQIDLNKKSLSATGYYFQPKNALGKGTYVGWIDGSFWLITLN